MIVREPPPLLFRAAPKKRLGCCSACASTPPERSFPEGGATTLEARATRYTRPSRPRLVITHGVSGSGKTSSTQCLVEATGAIRIRSDVERKRLYGLAPLERSTGRRALNLYAPETTQRTYERLAQARGWRMAPDGPYVRRVVPSPEPTGIVELSTIRLLIQHGVLVHDEP